MNPTTNSNNLYQSGNDYPQNNQNTFNGFKYLLNKINELSATVDETKDDIQTINSRLDGLDDNYTTLTNLMLSLNNKLDSFGSRLEALEDEVHHIVVSVPEYEVYNNEIRAIKPTTEDEYMKLWANHTNMDKNSNVIDQTYIDKNQYQTDISGLSANVSSLSSNSIKSEDYITPSQLEDIINGD